MAVEGIYRADVIEEARQRIENIKKEASHKFWYEHPDVLHQLKTIPTLRDLDEPLHIPKTVFLARLLFPISPSNLRIAKLFKSVLSELESYGKTLMPTEERTTRIIQSLRFLLLQQETRESVLNLLEKEDMSNIQIKGTDTDAKKFSFKSLFLRCIRYPLEIPAKEEVFYFIAALAMNFPKASSESANTYLLNILLTYRDSFREVDEHIIARRKAKEQHELTMMSSRFQVNMISRFLPPVFSYKRYKHKGSVAGHRMRSLSLFTAAIILHFWRRTNVIKSLISQCCECQQISKLHLLNLLQLVLDNWTNLEGKKVIDSLSNQMRELSKCKDECIESGQKKSFGVINECIKRFHVIRKTTGSRSRFSTNTALEHKKVKLKKP